MQDVHSIPQVCEVWTVSGPEAEEDAIADVFCDLPHGATRLEHLAHAKTLTAVYPDDRYDKLFLANTDQGAPEYALCFARMICDPDGLEALPGLSARAREQVRARVAAMKVVLIRCLIPRTIADVNRVWDPDLDFQRDNLTGVLAPFVTDPVEVAVLLERYDAYQAVTGAAYAQVCGAGGHAFNLHTYAPITVSIIKGEPILDTLERAYQPTNYASYPRRPEVELITATPEGEYLANPALAAAITAQYRRIGVDVHENEPFNLHPATTGTAHCRTYPGQVLVLELSRARLATRFDPFIEMDISPDKTREMSAPLAAGFLELLAAQPE